MMKYHTLPRSAQWGILLCVTAAMVFMLHSISLPGAFLMGAMAAGVTVALNGATLTMPAVCYQSAQAIIGTMIAATLTPAVFASFIQDWSLFLGVVLASLLVSSALGYALCRFKVMPGTTGIWGMTPGAASAMVIMAETYGADARLVAVMQYTRLLCVALTASVLAHFCAEPALHSVAPSETLPDMLTSFAPALGVAITGGGIALLLRIPSGMLLIPLAMGAVLSVTQEVELYIPHIVQWAAFIVLGWKIGLRFTRDVLIHSLKAFPKILLSVVTLMVFCAGLSVMVAVHLDVDELTAFLATSPGGADAMVGIAAAAHINLGFVMSVQVARLMMVMVLGPPLAKAVANRVVERK